MAVPDVTSMIPGPFTLIVLTLLFVAFVIGGPYLLAWILEMLMQE